MKYPEILWFGFMTVKFKYAWRGLLDTLSPNLCGGTELALSVLIVEIHL